ncbi:acyl carrier protein, partial [Klebsiella pneumoniae]
LDSKFIDIGMDSTRIMEAVGRLKMKLNSDIQASDFYNFETPRKLLEKMTSDSTFEQVGETDRKAVTDDIVIVGVSGR